MAKCWPWPNPTRNVRPFFVRRNNETSIYHNIDKVERVDHDLFHVLFPAHYFFHKFANIYVLFLVLFHWCMYRVRVGCPRNSANTEFRGIFWLLKWFLLNSGEIPRNSAEFRGISPELSRKSLPYSPECHNVTSVDTLGARGIVARFFKYLHQPLVRSWQNFHSITPTPPAT